MQFLCQAGLGRGKGSHSLSDPLSPPTEVGGEIRAHCCAPLPRYYYISLIVWLIWAEVWMDRT
jgi:hypothetical protein